MDRLLFALSRRIHLAIPCFYMVGKSFLASAFLFLAASANAQQGYEFEVYGASIPARGEAELELHTNFVFSGPPRTEEVDARPTHHAIRFSTELSTGLTSWLSASVYAIGYARNGTGLEYVGNRGRLTAIAPRAWGLPFELGMSHEIGFAREGFAENKWGYELTPIVGKDFGKISLLLNPAFEVGLGDAPHEWEFEPRARLAYKAGEDEGVALEYYSVLGPLRELDARSHQIHQLFLSGTTDLPSDVEATVGVGRGLTSNSDRWVLATRFEVSF